MINIHIYPSDFTNESRILREARSLNQFGYFDSVHLVGKGRTDLSPVEQIEPGLEVRRFGGFSDRESGVFGKIWRALRWGLRVYQEYRQSPLGCINCHSVSVLPVGAVLKSVSGAKLV